MSGDTIRDRPDPNENVTTILDTEHESEAMIAKGMLDSVGIDADRTSADAVQETFPGVGGALIPVSMEDAEKARRIIDESQRGNS